MTKTFQEAMAHRRSYYALKNESPITDNEIIDFQQPVNPRCGIAPRQAPASVGNHKGRTSENSIGRGFRQHKKQD